MSKPSIKILSLSTIAVLFTLFLTLLPNQTPPASAQQSDMKGPFSAVSKPPASFNGDVRTLPYVRPLTRRVLPEHKRYKPGTIPSGAPTIFPDTALQPALAAAAPMPTPSASFKGLDFDAWGAGWPPDTVGDVGRNHYIQAVNTSIGIFNKTGTRIAAFTFDTFFSGTGTPCDNLNQGDPNVNYDPLADRYIISDFAFDFDEAGDPVGPYYQCFAVSKTGDPVTGGWWQYGILTDQTDLADYPRIGVWPDGIYMSANMFGADGFTGVKVWAFNRDDLESGQAVRQISFDLDSNNWTLLPSNFRGTPPPPGRPNYFVSYQENLPQFAGSTLFIRKFTVTSWSPPAATLSGNTNVNVAQYREAPYLGPYVPELAGELLDTLADRLMMQNQYRNINGVESLWDMHTVIMPTGGPETGIRWYQLNVTGGTISTTPVQQSTYLPDTNYRWMGSLAVDKDGNMAMGYSVSSPAMFPAIRYAGRLATDPLNQLPQTETSMIEGTGSQDGGFTRWGDYSAMSVDPTDDCTFWYTQEYYDNTVAAPPATPTQNWQTRIGSFKYPSCVATPCTPTNVALASAGSTATASSTYVNGGYPPSSAIDGEHKGLNWGNNGGWNDGTRDLWPDSLEVTFNGNKAISEIIVYTLQNDYQNPVEPTPLTPANFYGIEDFDVQYWDGDSWETVTGGHVVGNDKAMRVFIFPDVTTTKIRVVVNKGRMNWSRIVEVEAFGCSQ